MYNSYVGIAKIQTNVGFAIDKTNKMMVKSQINLFKNLKHYESGV